MRIVLLCLALGLVGCKKHETEPPLAQVAKACSASEIGCPRPIFTVDNLRASQGYYADVLGFHNDWDDGDPPNFGAVSRGELQLFLCERCQGHPGGWIWVFAKDVDQLYAELTKRGADIRMPPTNMPWHVREMHVADRDGNMIRFGSPIDH
jgi:predicted enzyme related to lactoylglutathione lyase